MPEKDRKKKQAAARKGGKRSPAERSADGTGRRASTAPASTGVSGGTDRPRKGLSGVPGSKNPERRCTATARRTGNRCRRAAIKGGTVCTVHGGNLPQVRRAAKDRLLELVDPALASLHKVLSDPSAEDAVKVRAALGILDRTGFGPGHKIQVDGPDKFGEMLRDAMGGVDRDLSPAAERPALESGGGAAAEHTWEDVETEQRRTQAQAWREFDEEDARPWATRLDPYGPDIVRGEVVDPDPPGYGRDGPGGGARRG